MRKEPKLTYPVLCLDSETTNHGEILELSVFNGSGDEVFHQYFKPRAKTWPVNIHHITVERVQGCKRFNAYAHSVRALLQSSQFIIGCAINNDLHTLNRYGVDLGSKVTIIDIQNLFWLINDTSDRTEKRQVGLSAIAEHYGLVFGCEKAHSATADTRITLQCFYAMVDHFYRLFDYDAPDRNSPDVVAIFHNHMVTEYNKAMQVYRMKNSAGFINIVNRDIGHSLKYTRFQQPVSEKIIGSFAVNDRVKAEIDLRQYFEPKQIKGFTGIYNFDANDINYIRNYTNTIDLETFIARENALRKNQQSNSKRTQIRVSKPIQNPKANAPKPHKPRRRKPSKMKAAKNILKNATKGI